MAVKYIDTPTVTPQGGSRHHGTEREKYPPTCEFASSEEEFDSHLKHCMKARRPGGEYRASHGFHTITSGPAEHPVKSGTEKAEKFIIHCNVMED